LSLQLGVQGEREVLELEFTEPLDPADVFARVQQQAPNGLRFTQCDAIPLKANAVPRRAEYRFPIPAERADATQHACEELFAQPQVWLLKTHPKPRQVNVRPYIRALRVERSPCPELVLDLWVTGQGTARAEDLIRRLQLEDVIQSGAILRRTELELHDEVIAPKDHPPEGAPETRPAAMTELPPPGEPDHPARPTWGLSPSGPVVE
jgi:radical SAM-linked protein